MPVSCVWGQWTAWRADGECSGLDQRSRVAGAPNNLCGLPCEGEATQTMVNMSNVCDGSVKDCSFAEWDEWNLCTTDNTQSYRHRSISQEANHGGNPCIGHLQETRQCDHIRQACELSEWHEWTTCSVPCGVGQKDRVRRIIREADFVDGDCQNKSLNQVLDCMLLECKSQDCVFAEWTMWSACGPSGPERQKYRSRSISQPPYGSGKPCSGLMKETLPCEIGSQLCETTGWSKWSACSVHCGGGQTFRTRLMKEQGGCLLNTSSFSLRETVSCNDISCTSQCNVGDNCDCKFTEWAQWGNCSVKCGQGYRARQRTFLEEAQEKGASCLGVMEEIQNCDADEECQDVDCKWSEWHAWSTCSASCQGGTKHRMRVVDVAPRGVGTACEPLPSSEAVECNSQPCATICDEEDATWANWSKWSTCSISCTGGQVPAGCSLYSQLLETNSSGYQKRERQLATTASSCGKVAEGFREDYRPCSNVPLCKGLEDRDCRLGEWQEWSSCSSSCNGLRERNRGIEQYASGNGKPCDEEHIVVPEIVGVREVIKQGSLLQQAEACNPAKGGMPLQECGYLAPTPCILSDWSGWGACSRTCGGGQRDQTRQVEQYPLHSTTLCTDSLKMTEGCNPEPCDLELCIDCEWSEWSEWGACSKCGGQKYRQRHVQTYPSTCGKQCGSGATKEVTACPMNCGKKIICKWTPWSGFSSCPAGCGGTVMQSRTLAFASPYSDKEVSVIMDNTTGDLRVVGELFEAHEGATCTGMQIRSETCQNPECDPPCVPQNCDFTEWSGWGHATCAGLCSRMRAIAAPNNECGAACSGDLEENKECPRACDLPQKCELGAWTEWTLCNDPSAQKTRRRDIVKYPSNLGPDVKDTGCKEPLSETAPCAGNWEKTTCQFTNWTEWSECSSSCQGVQLRNRIPMALGVCAGALEELRGCGEGPEAQECTTKTNCEYSAWMEWSECLPDMQRARTRHISQFAAGGGTPCTAGLTEITGCGTDNQACVVSEWTSWDKCDRPCGGGQQQRHRQVDRWGSNCVADTIEDHACNMQPCGTEDGCVFEPWTPWTPCSRACGPAQTSRTRAIAKFATEQGLKCEGIMSITKACEDNPPCSRSDCVWEEWSQWSECSTSCGDGQQSRSRDLAREPSQGGLACEAQDKVVVRACKTLVCDDGSINGKWTEWTMWSPCSATCASGVTMRSRQVEVMASGPNGKPPYGDFVDTAFCNDNVRCQGDRDCVFTEWIEWGGCSLQCNGITERTRDIAQYGRENGAGCLGALKQGKPCNSLQNCPEDGGAVKPVDCVMGQWSAWSVCTATCGGGAATRARMMVKAGSDGGKDCDGELEQAQDCGRISCSAGVMVDCRFGDWQEWGACDRCGGQSLRLRNILAYPLNGGQECNTSSIIDTRPCPNACAGEGICSFQAWGPWGPCTATCGVGRMARNRTLQLVALGTAPMPATDDVLEGNAGVGQGQSALVSEWQQVQAKAQALEPRKPLELALAAASGAVSLAFALVAFRGISNARSQMSRTDGILPETDTAEQELPLINPLLIQ